MTEKFTGAAGRILSMSHDLLAIAGPLMAVVVYFAQIGPTISDHADKIADLKVAQAQTREYFEKQQAEQNARVDHIEDSRRDGLQRLAAVEQVAKATKDGLDQINAKLDRLLFSRLKGN